MYDLLLVCILLSISLYGFLVINLHRNRKKQKKIFTKDRNLIYAYLWEGHYYIWRTKIRKQNNLQIKNFNKKTYNEKILYICNNK